MTYKVTRTWVSTFALFSCLRKDSFVENFLAISETWQFHLMSLEMFKPSSLTLGTTSVAFSLNDVRIVLSKRDSHLFALGFV